MFEWWDNTTSIYFPNLGIRLPNVPRGFSVFGFNIAFYGLCIAIGMLGGIWMARWQAKRSGQKPDDYLDFALWAIPLSVVGARIYSVAFEWDYYKNDLKQIFNLRNGGLAIYGGLIAAIIIIFIYCKIKKMKPGTLADTAILGMLVGQACGRWGNFFNRECFGSYTDGLFAMQIQTNDVNLSSYFKPAVVSDARLAEIYAGKERAMAAIMEIRNNLVTSVDGIECVQVQPTYLYESVWNVCLLIILILVWRYKKFEGEIILLYLFGYGLGRAWIEGLRTDQLFLWNSGIAVSQLLSIILVVASAVIIIVCRTKAIKSGKIPEFCDYGNKELAKAKEPEEKTE